MERPLDELVELFRARDLCEAHVVRMALEEAEIPAAVEGEFLQGALGDVPVGWSTSPRVMVRKSQLEAARKIVGQTTDSSDSPSTLAAVADRLSPAQRMAPVESPSEETRCLACGTVMGEKADSCSACGWSYQCQEGTALVV